MTTSPEQLRAIIAAVTPLIQAIAEWERRNGTVAALMPDEYPTVAKIVSDWAMTCAPRRLEEQLALLRRIGPADGEQK